MCAGESNSATATVLMHTAQGRCFAGLQIGFGAGALRGRACRQPASLTLSDPDGNMILIDQQR